MPTLAPERTDPVSRRFPGTDRDEEVLTHPENHEPVPAGRTEAERPSAPASAMAPLGRGGEMSMSPNRDAGIALSPNAPSGITMRTREEDTEEVAEEESGPSSASSGEQAPAAPPDDEGNEGPATPSGPGAAEGAMPEAGGGGEAATPDQSLETGDSKTMMGSLTSMNAVSFANAMENASAAANDLQAQEKQTQQDNLPEIDQPTGIPTKKQKEAEATELQKEDAPQLSPTGKEEGRTIDTRHESPSGPVPGSHAPRFSEPAAAKEEDSGSWWSRLFSRIKSYLRSLPEGDSGVSTSAGERPKVDLSGQADPAQNAEHQEKATKSVDDKRTEADTETAKDFGEKDVYPDIETTKLAAETEIMGAEPRAGKPLGKREISGDVKAALNTNLQSRMDEQVGPKNQEFDEAHQTYEQDTEKEKEEGLKKIDDETARVKSEQEGQQAGAARQVEEERGKWRKENEDVKKTYEKQSSEKKKEIDKKIDTEVKDSEQKSADKLKDAEKEAEREKRKAEEEARRKKREAENRPRSFWDRVKGAVSDFFDKIRSAINAIFDGLRKLVKGIIELAKKVVKGLIELARRAIVGLIKAFGEALKAFVSVALAAFPELAKKARAAIDGVVDKAVTFVNKAAQALKDFADKVLDAIGKALDFILSVYQKIYNAIIDALEFIAVGIIEIIEGIANLVEAARKMPDHFWGEVSKELTGQDLTKPLPGLERTTPPPVPGASPGSAGASGLDPASAALLSKSSLSAEDVVIDPVPEIDLDPELLSSLALAGGGELSFGGEAPGDLTLDELRAMAGVGGVSEGVEGIASSGGIAEPGVAGGGPDFASMTDAQKMEYYLSQMNPQCGDMKGEAPTGETDSSIPDVAKVGPLSVAQRAGFVLEQVKKGIANWWECNKVMIISIMVGALLGLAVAAFFTGGAAILAALQALMTALTVIFGAILVAKMGYHLGLYLKKAWGGDIEGGAQSLARAIAVGLVELVFNFLFKVGGLLLKVVKQAAKAIAKAAKGAGKLAVKAGKATVQGLKAVGKSAFKFTRRIASPVIKSGKVYLKGIQRGFAKGIKKVKDLGKKLKDHFGFRGFSLEVKGTRFFLYGHFNPKKLLATGNVKDVSAREARRLRKAGSNEELVGKTINTGGKKAIVVSDDFARKLEGMTMAERAAKFKELEKMSAAEIRKLAGVGKSTYHLRKGIKGAKPPNYQAHHVVPEELLNNPSLKKFLDEIGFNIQDGARNGIMLPPSKAARFGKWSKATVHSGYHRNYTARVKAMVEQSKLAYEAAVKSGVPAAAAKAAALKDLAAKIRILRQGLLKGAIPLS